jgi:hypothetical protein
LNPDTEPGLTVYASRTSVVQYRLIIVAPPIPHPQGHLVIVRRRFDGVLRPTEWRGSEVLPDFLALLAGAKNFFPLFSSLVISFDLFVPSRLHEKYLVREKAADVETFHVQVRYRYSMPVAYIHYTVTGSEDQVYQYSPSNAVVVVREFLEEKLSDDPVIDFQFIGPSPCHVEVFIDTATSAAAVEAKDLSIVGAGYRTLFFRLDAITPKDQVIELARAHHGVLGAFYAGVILRNRARRLSTAVADGALELLKPSTRSSRWAAFRRWRGYRQQIDAVFTALLQEKLNRFELGSFQDEINQDDELDQSSLFYPFIERELDEHVQTADEDIRELLIMLEERRRGYFANLSVLISGLVGGILGAALGALLTFGLTDHSGAKAKTETINRAPDARSLSEPH